MLFGRRFFKNTRGAVLVEFALGSLLFFTVMFATIEWSLSLYARSSLHQHNEQVARVFANTRDLDRLASEIGSANVLLGLCLQNVEVAFFDDVEGFSAPVYVSAANVNAVDVEEAVHFSIRMECRWPAFLPTGALMSSMPPEFSLRSLGFE